jgi:hypothetical protein
MVPPKATSQARQFLTIDRGKKDINKPPSSSFVKGRRNQRSSMLWLGGGRVIVNTQRSKFGFNSSHYSRIKRLVFMWLFDTMDD